VCGVRSWEGIIHVLCACAKEHYEFDFDCVICVRLLALAMGGLGRGIMMIWVWWVEMGVRWDASGGRCFCLWGWG